MDAIFSVIKYAIFGFLGLIAVLIVLALLFGRRVRKQWEYEAEFHDENHREFAEFDIESSRIEKQEADFTTKIHFRMRHDSLLPSQDVQVFVDETMVLRGTVKEAGRVRLGSEDIVEEPENVRAGQNCRIVIDGAETFSASLVPD